jgi:DNA-binding protein HU-beta
MAKVLNDVAAKAGVKPEVARSVLDAIKDIVNTGEKVQLHKFGAFELRKTAARKGINPKTKEPIDIPAGTKFSFKASKKG